MNKYLFCQYGHNYEIPSLFILLYSFSNTELEYEKKEQIKQYDCGRNNNDACKQILNKLFIIKS